MRDSLMLVGNQRQCVFLNLISVPHDAIIVKALDIRPTAVKKSRDVETVPKPDTIGLIAKRNQNVRYA